MQVGSKCTPGMITDYSETLRLDNLESEVVGGVCVGLQTVQDTTECAFSGESCKIFSRHLTCKNTEACVWFKNVR